MNKTIFIAFLLIGIACIYVLFAMWLGDIFVPTNRDYYTYALDAFLQGRVNLITPYTYDLAYFHNQWYMYWGPSPVLFVLPFYLFTGLSTSDILYTLIAGILNCVIFFLLLREVQTHFKHKLSLFGITCILLSFAFASPNFYLSLKGSIWHTVQIVGTLYLLISYLFAFKFINNDKRLSFFILSVIFFNLAWMARYPILFQLPILGYLFYTLNKRHGKFPLKLLGIFCTITALFVSLLLWYNYLKFGNIFETGLRYVIGNERFGGALQQNKLLSPDYISHNATYYFLHLPQFTPQPPYLKTNPEGNSIFFFYPALLLLFAFFTKTINLTKQMKTFALFAAISIGATISFLMLYFATGWIQLGNRYIFDIIPLLFLIIAFLLPHISKSLLFLTLFFGIIVNILGILTFYT